MNAHDALFQAATNSIKLGSRIYLIIYEVEIYPGFAGESSGGMFVAFIDS